MPRVLASPGADDDDVSGGRTEDARAGEKHGDDPRARHRRADATENEPGNTRDGTSRAVTGASDASLLSSLLWSISSEPGS